MGIKKYAKGLGVYSNDVTKDINKASFNRGKRTVEWNDAWRKAKEEDPSIEFRMTFPEFKKTGLKNLKSFRSPRK